MVMCTSGTRVFGVVKMLQLASHVSSNISSRVACLSGVILAIPCPDTLQPTCWCRLPGVHWCCYKTVVWRLNQGTGSNMALAALGFNVSCRLGSQLGRLMVLVMAGYMQYRQ